ncbi:esterase/lipase family protein [Arthrobacter gallicola]|uniref:esterase/lipase family protein n=1 Tax=Arthrobacter gallicola TaxID=2762225 RepID=UPI001CD88107|nr:alpha/beta hydrolase [Arthrobacter gallicola]
MSPQAEEARLGAGVRRRLLLAAAWAADYAYVVRWQIQGFIFQSDPAVFLQPAAGVDPREPVLLIPGVYENWQFLRPLAQYLAGRGHPVHAVRSLGYNRGTVEEMARRVEAYLRHQGIERAAIAAHSKGGLIGKKLLLGPEGHRISHLVAINTPFAGSPYARLFPLRSIRAFSPRDFHLRRLQANLETNSRITSVYASFDPHIPGGSQLEGARNIVLEAMGHFRPVGDPVLHRIVAEELERGTA